MTDTPLARSTDPSTSHSAAESAVRFVVDHEARILAALSRPMTCYEIAAATTLDHVAVARRMRKLVDDAKVRDSGETRAGPNGRACTVWETA
jgi:predicted ArsR family transcriptional regulator